jgi:hypothetical protein
MGANKMKLGEKVLVIGGEYHGRLGTFIDNYPMTQRLQDTVVPYIRIVIKPEGETILPAADVEFVDIIMPMERLLKAVYEAVSNELHDAAGDLILHHVDEWMLAGNFDACDKLLSALDLERLDAYAVVVLLAATICAKDKLVLRAIFVEHAKERLQVLAPDRVEELMKGLD